MNGIFDRSTGRLVSDSSVLQRLNRQEAHHFRAGDPVANMELWQRLLEAAKAHRIEWRWVRGHSGDPMNERVDRLATKARTRITSHDPGPRLSSGSDSGG